MTDKQIIIDGVDVSGCDRLNSFPMQYGEPHEICLTSLEQWGGQEKYCKDRPNCYYKQLKRDEQRIVELNKTIKAKEQECERLKSVSIQKCPQCGEVYLNLVGVEAFDQIDQLKADYAELEKRHNDSFEQFKQLKTENDELKKQCQADKGLITSTGKMNYQLIEEYDKLKTENDELKEEQNKKRDHYFIIANENARLQDEKARLGYKLNSEIQKLKQTLTEIKEIAEHWIYTEVADELAGLILQKISEVENG